MHYGVFAVPNNPRYRDLDRRILVLAAARAVNTAGLSLVMAFMAVYLVTDRGLSAPFVGVVYAVSNGLQAIAQAYAGELSDRIGRVRLMVLALGARVVFILGLGVLVLAHANVWAIFALMLLSWCARGAFEPVAHAVVADVARPGERVAAFGLQKLGINLGWALGPAVGGVLKELLGFGWVFFLAAPILLAVAVAVARVREPEIDRAGDGPRPTRAEAVRAALGDPRTVLFLAGALLAGLVHAQLFSPLSVYATRDLGLRDDQLGLLWTINAAVVILFQMPAVRAIARIGAVRALIIGPVLYAGAFALFGAASDFALLAAGIAVLSLGEVVFEPAEQTVAAELGDPRRMGRAMGLLGGMRMLGMALALLVGGAAIDHLHDAPLRGWTLLLCLPALQALLYLVFSMVRRR